MTEINRPDHPLKPITEARLTEIEERHERGHLDDSQSFAEYVQQHREDFSAVIGEVWRLRAELGVFAKADYREIINCCVTTRMLKPCGGCLQCKAKAALAGTEEGQ